MPSINTTPWLTVEETSDILRMNPETLRRLARQGRINFRRSGNRYVFSPQFIESYLKINAAKPIHRRRRRN